MNEKYYDVEMPEVHYATMRIKASSPEKAREKVRDGEGELVTTEYSHMSDHLDIEDWPTDEIIA